MTETERKFIVGDRPADDALGPGMHLRQGYLARDGLVEVRVRVTEGVAVLTVKAGRGLSRTEVETEISRGQAEALWPFTAGRRLEKNRHRVPVGRLVAEVDVYLGQLTGLCTVEVEFASAAEAADFEPPSWFGREVTGEPGWTNASLAEDGIPK